MKAPFAALLAFAMLAGCAWPTRDQEALKAIESESRQLMALPAAGDHGSIPASQWPPAIARLKPEMVTVGPDGVHIMVKPNLDGGWGYYVPRDERQAREPDGRYSQVHPGVFWYHPY